MIKGIILLADGFEEVEALQTYDVLSRNKNFDVSLVSINGKEAISSHHLHLTNLININDIDSKDYSFLCLPGGKRGVDNLALSERVKQLVLEFAKEGKLLAMICAVPSIAIDLGLLENKKFTCFPSFQRGKENYFNIGVVRDENFITGHSMGYTLEFAKEIIRYYFGEKGVEEVKEGIYG